MVKHVPDPELVRKSADTGLKLEERARACDQIASAAKSAGDSFVASDWADRARRLRTQLKAWAKQGDLARKKYG